MTATPNFSTELFNKEGSAIKLIDLRGKVDCCVIRKKSKMVFLKILKNFFCKYMRSSPFSLLSLNWYQVSEDETQLLQKPFSTEEVLIALKESDSMKSPGPDGINAGWLKKLWPFLHNEVLEFFHKFYSESYIPHGAYSSFIDLIPKRPNPASINNIRPISLINSSFKLLLKVLSNRLKLVLIKVISVNQSAFLT